MNYFPFFRGRQNELIAIRELASSIARNGRIIPIIEPVRANPTTRKSIDQFIEASMPFLFICNPIHGKFSSDHVGLRAALIDQALIDYDNWIPSLYVNEQTAIQELDGFIKTYDGDYPLALIYYGQPEQNAVCKTIDEHYFQWHVIVDHRVPNDYIQSIPAGSCVRVHDQFVRRRNADYPNTEFFTDLNTVAGNADRTHFGDFSIVGDHYTESGGPAYAVTLHHVHYKEGSRTLYISHFISDRTSTPVDPAGKTIEALNHLVDTLDALQPNNTQACQEYKDMRRSEHAGSLGYMKRMAIKHHLEVMLGDSLEW